jgi:hypothetical protein
MSGTGTGTDPTTERCPDCGHPLDVECGCGCCFWHLTDEQQDTMAERDYERRYLRGV